MPVIGVVPPGARSGLVTTTCPRLIPRPTNSWKRVTTDVLRAMLTDAQAVWKRRLSMTAWTLAKNGNRAL